MSLEGIESSMLGIEHQHGEHRETEPDAALDFSSDVRITVAKDAQTAAALLFDPN
jgi:hypothetical protein